MTREITRPVDYSSQEEAEKFGGPFWEQWKHSILSHLNVDDFPSPEVEDLLHKWWSLRMSFKLKIISQEEFDEGKRKLFPDYPEGDPRDPLSDPLVLRAVRYTTEKTAPDPKQSSLSK